MTPTLLSVTWTVGQLSRRDFNQKEEESFIVRTIICKKCASLKLRAIGKHSLEMDGGRQCKMQRYKIPGRNVGEYLALN